jgi:hypothetical protein
MPGVAVTAARDNHSMVELFDPNGCFYSCVKSNSKQVAPFREVGRWCAISMLCARYVKRPPGWRHMETQRESIGYMAPKEGALPGNAFRPGIPETFGGCIQGGGRRRGSNGMEEEANSKTKMADSTGESAILIAGSPGRTRTSDRVVNSHLLYRLSYRGKFQFRCRGLYKTAETSCVYTRCPNRCQV